MVPLGMVLDAVERCPALVRFGMVSPSDVAPFKKWTTEDLASRLLRMCLKLNNLMCMFLVMTIPKSYCPSIMKRLNHVLGSKRPAFCVDIQGSDKSSLDCESSSLPLIHREFLGYCNSRVAIVPYDFKSFIL